MDFLRQLPIGQFVAEESAAPGGADRGGSWLRRLDPRLKLAWTVAFLVTPILAGPVWRLALVGLLLVITALSGLPEVFAQGQGGLLDVMVPRDFATSREIWLSYARPARRGGR